MHVYRNFSIALRKGDLQSLSFWLLLCNKCLVLKIQIDCYRAVNQYMDFHQMFSTALPWEDLEFLKFQLVFVYNCCHSKTFKYLGVLQILTSLELKPLHGFSTSCFLMLPFIGLVGGYFKRFYFTSHHPKFYLTFNEYSMKYESNSI